MQLYNAQAAAAAAAPDDPVAAAAPTHTSHHTAPTTTTFHHTPTFHSPYLPPHHPNTIPAPTTFKWTGPVAATVGAGVNGQIVPVSDTADVAAATRAFNAAYADALRATGNAVHLNTHQVIAPVAPVPATIPAGLPGAGAQVAATADVTAATAAFEQAYRAAVLATTGRV